MYPLWLSLWSRGDSRQRGPLTPTRAYPITRASSRSFRAYVQVSLAPPNRTVCSCCLPYSSFVDIEHGEHLGDILRGDDPAEQGRRKAVSIGVRGRRETGRCAIACMSVCCERPGGGRERTVTSPLAFEVVVVAKIHARPRGIYSSRPIASCPARAEGTEV